MVAGRQTNIQTYIHTHTFQKTISRNLVRAHFKIPMCNQNYKLNIRIWQRLYLHMAWTPLKAQISSFFSIASGRKFSSIYLSFVCCRIRNLVNLAKWFQFTKILCDLSTKWIFVNSFLNRRTSKEANFTTTIFQVLTYTAIVLLVSNCPCFL